MIRVEVAYVGPEGEFLESLVLEDGATLAQAIELSGLCRRRPSVEVREGRAGIFGRIRPLDQRLREGDRVEVYRALAADPKDTRRRRAASNRKPR